MVINEKWVKGQMVTELSEAQEHLTRALQAIGWDYMTDNDDDQNKNLKRTMQGAFDNIGAARDILTKAAEPPKNGSHDTHDISEHCEKCGAPMVEKSGKKGKFLACSAFPKCRNTKSLKETVKRE